MASLTNRYTDALLAVTEAEGSTARVTEDLEVLRVALEDREFRQLLENPGIGSRRKSELLGGVLAAGGRSAHDRTKRFLDVVLARGRQSLLPGIVTTFRALALETKGEVEGHLESALPLAPDDLERIAASLSATVGKKVVLDTKIDAELLGGFRVRIADRMYDASLKGQLESLGRKLKGIAVADLRGAQE